MINSSLIRYLRTLTDVQLEQMKAGASQETLAAILAEQRYREVKR